ncbi:hypothetical protein J4E93_010512 [Alternaria ventricosa]|uniref:uncharacterized protein n=1 Tax=Alternaria ventricosa TaxID=1187951 RepID=UPI0020C4348D|nr:uncharacterized protein J4E93_010512 [Alternaria ventricosa]KAI4638044.1 hypothetical protein J4E93_010512 [Alternaria ventricosa]
MPASAQDKLAETKCQEKLKATILTHAKAVFVEGLTKDTDLDVVTGTVKGYTAAWVVAYVKKDDGLRLITLLQSLGNPNVEDAYQALIIGLRSKMNDAIVRSDFSEMVDVNNWMT